MAMAGGTSNVEDFIEGVTPQRRQRDARTLLDMMRRVTGEDARVWGSIVAFGEYHYKYASGREGDAPAAAFAPRKTSTTVYLMDGVDTYSAELETLGPHKTGVGCLYINDLEKVDLAVLEDIVSRS